jgi:phenylalanyl-tRNA synthetase beta chain
MKFSELWLREFINPPINTKTLLQQLTMAGLEVDEVTQVANTFSGVLIGFVVSAEQHPNADRLRVCQVDVGYAEPLQIVCGGANVRTGLKVAVAIIGAVLSDNFIIKAAKLRGVASQGMICSAQELGLEDSSEGILELAADAPVGMDVRDYLTLDDQIITVDLTPNRGDCLSIFGVAREVAAINACPVPTIPAYTVLVNSAATFPVHVQAPEDCPQYVGRVIQNVNPTAQTPVWLKERLRRSGIRSVHWAVDVTQYVLLELGQPLHAFDLDKLSGSVIVRRALSQESLTLLDNRVVSLTPETLIIADEKNPLALAGIMGGINSAISDSTTQIFLESAFFNPLVLAGRARSYGLSTDASHRFERFVSPELQIPAIERATQLILEIGGGTAGPLTAVRSDAHLPQRLTLALRKNQIPRLLGIHLADVEVQSLLERLNMQWTVTKDGWDVAVPLYRFDLQAEVDLIEEIARIYGYDNIKPVTSAIPVNPSLSSLRKGGVEGKNLRRIQHFFLHRGYQEAITYSFVDPKMHALIFPDQKPLALENPISPELSVMRASLWPGLLQAALNNQRHQQLRIRFFEIGLCFPSQQPMLAAILTGTRYPDQWGVPKKAVDFFDMKADVESLFNDFGQKNMEFRPGSHCALHPGQTAHIYLEDELVGYLGALHPKWLQQLEFETPVYLFEVALNAFAEKAPFYHPFSKFPSIRRDIAVLVNQDILSINLLNAVKLVAGEYLKDVWVFDVYQGSGIEANKKSLAMGLMWQCLDRTLLDAEIAEKMQKIITVLETDFGATLRG